MQSCSMNRRASTDNDDVEILLKELVTLQNKYVNIKKLEAELNCSKEEFTMKRNKLLRMVGCFHSKQDQLLKSSIEGLLTSVGERMKSSKKQALNQDDIWTNSAKHRTIRKALRNVKRNVDAEKDLNQVHIANKLQRQIKLTCKAKRIKEEIESIKSATIDIDKFWSDKEKDFIAWFKDVNTTLIYLQEKCGE